MNYLKSVLDCPVEMEESTHDEYVLIEKTGSSKTNHINTASLTIQSYSTSLYKTALLNESVKEAMERLPFIEDVSKVTCDSDYNFTDTQTKRYRYQAIFDLVF